MDKRIFIREEEKESAGVQPMPYPLEKSGCV